MVLNLLSKIRCHFICNTRGRKVKLTVLFQIGSISFIGKFETDTGWVKNLATINRINDVSVTRPDPMKTSFHVTLKIKDLQVRNVSSGIQTGSGYRYLRW